MVIFVTGIFLNYYIKLHRSNYMQFFKTNPQNKAQQRCSAPCNTLLRDLPCALLSPDWLQLRAPSPLLGLDLETKPPSLHLLWKGVQTQSRCSQAAPGTRPAHAAARGGPSQHPKVCAGRAEQGSWPGTGAAWLHLLTDALPPASASTLLTCYTEEVKVLTQLIAFSQQTAVHSIASANILCHPKYRVNATRKAQIKQQQSFMLFLGCPVPGIHSVLHFTYHVFNLRFSLRGRTSLHLKTANSPFLDTFQKTTGLNGINQNQTSMAQNSKAAFFASLCIYVNFYWRDIFNRQPTLLIKIKVE